MPLAFRKRTKTRQVILHASKLPVNTEQPHALWMVPIGRTMGLLHIGYHFVVEQDGSIVQTRPFTSVGNHMRGSPNNDSIGVCLAGGGNGEDNFTDAQTVALYAIMVLTLRPVYGDLPLVGHNELNFRGCRECGCPPTDMRKLRDDIQRYAVTGALRSPDAPDQAPA